MDNNFAEIALDNGEIFQFYYNEFEKLEFCIDNRFIMVYDGDEILALFNVNNVASAVFSITKG